MSRTYKRVEAKVTENRLISMKCDKCGKSLLETYTESSLDWTTCSPVKEDGTYEDYETYLADFCDKCALSVIALLRDNGIHVQQQKGNPPI